MPEKTTSPKTKTKAAGGKRAKGDGARARTPRTANGRATAARGEPAAAEIVRVIRSDGPLLDPNALSSATTLDPGLDRGSAQFLDHVASKVRQVVHLSGLAGIVGLGRLVITAFYNGDLNAWKKRGPKEVSFEKLCARSDLGVEPWTLRRMVHAFVTLEETGVVTKLSLLGPSHLYAVQPLPLEEQKKLLLAASEEEWTVEKLQKEVEKARKGTPKRGGGRPPMAPVLKFVNRVARLLDGEKGIASAKGIEGLEKKELAELRKNVKQLLKVLGEVEGRLAGVE